MFSYFGSRFQEMAFTAHKHQFARVQAARYIEETLAAFLQGQERAYAVEDALRELRALFQQGADMPEALIRQGLADQDESRRTARFDKALDLIGRQVRAGNASASSAL